MGEPVRTVRRCAEVVVQELDGHVLLLRSGACDVVHLNETAAALWAALAGTEDLEAAVRAVAGAYAVEVERVRTDVAPVVAALLAAGLLVAVGDDA